MGLAKVPSTSAWLMPRSAMRASACWVYVVCMAFIVLTLNIFVNTTTEYLKIYSVYFELRLSF
jgi:hypothetical protein